jgi:putative ABC transport system permease protein
MQNIKSNKMRSFLTMLGIIIGVAAVIGLITIVQSVSNYVMNEFSSLGAGTVSVSAFGNAMKQGLNDNDIQTLNGIEGVAGVSPTVSLTGTAVFETEAFDKVNIDGKAAVYFQRNPELVEAGRPLTVSDMSGDTNVCIVDHTFIEKVMLGHEIIGNTIRLNGMEYTIVGIQGKSNNLQGAFMDTSDSNGTVLIPYHNALRLTGKANVNSLEVYIEDGVESAEVEKRLRSALNNIYNNADNSFSVFNFESLMTAMSTIEGMMSTMLGGIASIALLVGGIGIMNMMLVSVSERTKEIGLRKA